MKNEIDYKNKNFQKKINFKSEKKESQCFCSKCNHDVFCSEYRTVDKTEHEDMMNHFDKALLKYSFPIFAHTIPDDLYKQFVFREKVYLCVKCGTENKNHPSKLNEIGRYKQFEISKINLLKEKKKIEETVFIPNYEI